GDAHARSVLDRPRHRRPWRLARRDRAVSIPSAPDLGWCHRAAGRVRADDRRTSHRTDRHAGLRLDYPEANRGGGEGAECGTRRHSRACRPPAQSLMPKQVSEPLVVPRWVRAVDIVCLLFVALAWIVSMSGGFRLHIGCWRIAVTSPYPLLLWALAIGVGRRFSAPTVPIYRDLPPRVIGWWRRPGVSTAATVIVGTRPAILLVGYLAVFVFGYAGGRAPLRHFHDELANLPVRWDAGWYLQIVTNGYSYVPGEPELQQNIVFFPAYPMLVRGLGRLLGGRL